MKPACTHTDFVELVVDMQIPAADKGDVLVIWGSYMRELGIICQNRTESSRKLSKTI